MDVVLDLMIHDIDVVLSLVGSMPEEIRAAGISILTGKVDIANVRLAFPGGCVANLTASRVSTERVRKLRLFQPHQYLSLDYSKQEVFSLSVTAGPPDLVQCFAGGEGRAFAPGTGVVLRVRGDARRATGRAAATPAAHWRWLWPSPGGFDEHSQVVARSLASLGKA